MTIDELLETVPTAVRDCIDEIAARAGTYDADWSVLKAAGELLAAERARGWHPRPTEPGLWLK